MRKINIMGIRSKAIMNRTDIHYLVMQAITEEEENMIDNSVDEEGSIKFLLEGKHVIPGRDIFLYGKVDVTNPDDVDVINKAKIITEEINQAANIPSNLDYETGDIYAAEDDRFKNHDTWNKLDWFKFNHVLIGKPERIIIYRIAKKYVPRNRSTRSGNNELSPENI